MCGNVCVYVMEVCVCSRLCEFVLLVFSEFGRIPRFLKMIKTFGNLTAVFKYDLKFRSALY